MPIEQPYAEDRRKNGWGRPWDQFQMLSWVIFTFLMLTFFLVFVPLLEQNDERIWAAIGYGVLLAAVIVGWVISSSTDPVDKTIWSLLQATPREYPSGELLYCCFCKCKVHKRSKHCRVCNKCVGDFDHHCKWLNNCVGGANYKTFFFLINAAMALTAFHTGWGIKVVRDTLANEAFPEDVREKAWFQSMDRTGLLSLLFVSTVASGGVCVLLLHLVGFHIFLIAKGISTYDYILLQRAKAIEKQQKKDQKSNRVGAELKETPIEMEVDRSRQTSMASGESMVSGSRESMESTESGPAYLTAPANKPPSTTTTPRPSDRPRPEEPAHGVRGGEGGGKTAESGNSPVGGGAGGSEGKKAIRLKPLPPSAAAQAESVLQEREIRDGALLPGVVGSTEGETPKD